MRHDVLADRELEDRVRRTLAEAARTVDTAELPIVRRQVIRRSRSWRYLSIAAACVAGVAGIVAVQRVRSASDGPSSPAIESVPVGTTIDEPLEITLDGWVAPGAVESDPAGPFKVFDLERLPEGWTVEQVTGFHPVVDLTGYIWQADLRDPDREEWRLTLGTRTERMLHLLDSFEVTGEVTVRGRSGAAGEHAISWEEDGEIAVQLQGRSGGSRVAEAVALADSLVTTTINDLPGVPSPGAANVRTSADLGGLIQGHVWQVIVYDSQYRGMNLRIDGGGDSGFSHDALSQKPGSIPFDVAVEGVTGGVVIYGFAPPEVANVTVVLGSGAEVSLPIISRAGDIAFALPIPEGLDAVAIDFDGADGTRLHRILLPIFPPSVGDGGAGGTGMPFGDVDGAPLLGY